MILTREKLIAPCGLDCSLCYRFKRSKDACPGCRGDDREKLKSCLNCRIKNCEAIKSGAVEYCADCNQFPCKSIKRLDRDYRKSYCISVIENFARMKALGLPQYVAEQDEKWVCKSCGGKRCMHKVECANCGTPGNTC